MSLTEAELRRVQESEAADQAERDAVEAVAGRDLLERTGNKVVAAKKGKPVVMTPEEAAEDAKDAYGDLLDDIKEKIGDDHNLAIAIRFILQEKGEAPLPPWLSLDSMFSATVDFGQSGKVTISVTTFGNKIDSFLNLRVAEIGEELKKLDEMLKEYQDREEDLPIDQLKVRNQKVADLGTVQAASMYAWMITGWEGPMFSWLKGYHNYKEGDVFPLLSSLDYEDEDDVKVGSEILRSVPQKALTMIEQGIKILNIAGLEGDFQMGN